MARVLIVDDERDLRDSMSAGLTEGGHEVETVDSAARALEAVQGKEPFDVVILDLGLPDRDGLQILSELRERCGGAPVIVVSANSAMASMVTAMRDGAFDYLSKPLRPEQLEQRVDHALRLAQRAGSSQDRPSDMGPVEDGARSVKGRSSVTATTSRRRRAARWPGAPRAALATDLAVLPATDDPLESADAIEERLAELLPTAALQWEVRGEEVVLRAHVGLAQLEVVPLPGGRVRITTVTPPAPAPTYDEGDALD